MATINTELQRKAAGIGELLSVYRLDLAQEKRAQRQIASLLAGLREPFHAEYLLSPRDVIDFLIGPDGESGVGLEVKLRAQRKAIYRQLERYAQHPRVGALVLFTATSMALPDAINDKPAVVVSAGGGWL